MSGSESTTPNDIIVSPSNNNNNNSNIIYNIMSSNSSNYNSGVVNNSGGGSLSPSSSIQNFSLLNDIYFQNTNDVNELINKIGHGSSISAGSIANINSGTSSNIHANTHSATIHHKQINHTSSSSSSATNEDLCDHNGLPGYDVDLIVQTTKQEDSRFMGKKKRRNSSVSKVFLGDFLRLSSNVSILKMISKYGDNQILFSDVLIKVNKRNKMQERIIIITDKSIYNVDPKDYKLKRRISLENVTSISMSTMEDNFIILHVSSEYDYVLVGGRKIEIATILLESYHRLTFYQITPYNLPNINNSNSISGNSNPTTNISIPTTTTSNNNSIVDNGNSPPSTSSTSSSNNNNNNHNVQSSPSSSTSPPSKLPSPLNLLKSVGVNVGSGNNSNSNSRSGNSSSNNNNNNNNEPINNIGILSPTTPNNSNVSVIHRITGSVLPVKLSDRIEYRIEGDSLREIVFTRVQGSVNISIQSVKSRPLLKRELSKSSNLPTVVSSK